MGSLRDRSTAEGLWLLIRVTKIATKEQRPGISLKGEGGGEIETSSLQYDPTSIKQINQETAERLPTVRLVYMTLWKRQNHGDRNELSGYQGRFGDEPKTVIALQSGLEAGGGGTTRQSRGGLEKVPEHTLPPETTWQYWGKISLFGQRTEASPPSLGH